MASSTDLARRVRSFNLEEKWDSRMLDELSEGERKRRCMWLVESEHREEAWNDLGRGLRRLVNLKE